METTLINKEKLAAKFREAGATIENKLHIISWEGQWQIVKEGSKRALGTYAEKAKAKAEAAHYLKAGKAEEVVVHHRDGSVEERLTLRS